MDKRRYRVLVSTTLLTELGILANILYDFKALNIDEENVVLDSSWTTPTEALSVGIPHITFSRTEIKTLKAFYVLSGSLWHSIEAAFPEKLAEAINFINEYQSGAKHAINHPHNKRT